MSSDERKVVMEAIVRCYPAIGITTDNLPYSPAFDLLRQMVELETRLMITECEFWSLIIYTRKVGRLPRVR